MRRVANPPNPYHSAWREYLGPSPPARLEVYEEQAHSIIAANDSPDVGFDFSVNPYRGCQHACAYCYARPSHEYLDFGAGTDFETRLIVKVNAPELLREELGRRKWRGAMLAFSGVTDCYQPLEVTYQLTRRCLEACVDYANPVGIVTKAYLVARDLDVLQALHQQSEARVLISVPIGDAKIARLLEPGAPPPAKRFEAMRRLVDGGIPVGVMVAPVIPGLTDRGMPEVLRRAADAGADCASLVPLRLPANVRPVFFERLRSTLPAAAARVEARLRDVRNGALNESRFGARLRGQGIYWESIKQLFRTTADRCGLRTNLTWREDGAPTTRASAEERQAAVQRQLPLFETL